MARIWQEGFEDGLPSLEYLESSATQQISGFGLNLFPDKMTLASGRNAYSNKSLYINGAGAANIGKTFSPSLSSLYCRVYFKYDAFNGSWREIVWLKGEDGNVLLSMYMEDGAGLHSIRTRESGTYAARHTFTLLQYTWYKLDIYLNISLGAYEVKLDDVSIKSGSGLNLGSSNVLSMFCGFAVPTTVGRLWFDDIAVNNTSGSINNSWCGGGTIVSLKPKGSGNSTQWDTCQGYAKAESGSGTTTLKITGHGLATNDVILNKTRNVYSIVTVVDANTLTTSSITGQAQNDIILLYNYQATIAATATTNTSQVTLVGHNLISGDVFVNTTRSNAIRKVLYTNGNAVINSQSLSVGVSIGASVTSQASNDSIKTFKFKPYAISNHWEAVLQTEPSPQYAYIQSSTSGDIDLFDMQELAADLGIPSSSSIVAVSANIYAKEMGAGSQIKPVLRSNGSNNEGSTISLSSGTLEYQTIYDTSPFTANAWTRAEVDGLEAGVKLV